MISETDLAIVHALQLNPRATWRDIGGALELSAETVSRRWEALRDEGTAWIMPVPGPRYLSGGASAFVFLASAASHQNQLVERLCGNPAFGTVSRVAGPHDLAVDCFAGSHEELAAVLTTAFADAPEVLARDVLLVTRLFRQAYEWHEDALAHGPASSLAPPRGAARPTFSSDATDGALIRALAQDGRIGWAELAATCGISPQTARRRVDRLVDAGLLAFRCDTAAEVHPGQRDVTLVLEVPPDRLEPVGRYCAALPSCRVSAQVLGAGNLLATLRVRDLLAVHALEQDLARAAPGTRVVSRHPVFRTDKRMGRLLGPGGRAAGVVPLPL
ncbi:Lrp/AsnC family transcriptional regulator [Sinomonas sp. JGH33]|uniref:Lrp/AsnC family transcriptional regulator n=1 Tax=Sinomonas terricola TaxID=3110330 RepID=A0ABU5TCA1_9MICC|nr:Lrp/AsnC family transcriptional regulator [Sinomonas sp. JGH33]MEA5457323.1 Lrp/AsnC family transcriptional regulator [Sinomonas sp. JGH33]